MDPKERVLRSLDFKPVDRVARYDNFWPEFSRLLKNYKNIDQAVELTDYFKADLLVIPSNESPYPNMEEIISENKTEIIKRNNYGMITRVRKGAYFEEELEHIIQTYDDLERYTFEPADLEMRYSVFTERVKNEKAKKKCVFSKIGGPYIRSSFLRGKEDFLMDIVNDEGFARELAERVADLLLKIGLEELKRGDLYDTGIWIYDDMGFNMGPMFSPKSFEKIFLPSYIKIVSGLKKAGARKVCLHSDGDIRLLLDMLISAGIDAINPVEPRAGMSISKLKIQYGNKLAYIGGMCNSDVLKNGPDERIIAQTKEIIELAADGGVVIGAHSIGIDIPVENFLLYSDYVDKYGVFDNSL